MLDRRTNDNSFSGVVLIARGDEVLYVRARGLADRAAGRLVTAETRFNLASTTKVFTATAVMQLAAQGKLDLQAPIARVLPDLPDSFRALTLHQLLTHTAGLGDLITSKAFRAAPEHFRELKDYVDALLAQPPPQSPGEFEYSNDGFILAAAAVEKVAAEPFWDYVRHHILDPAGLRSTDFVLRPQPQGLATGYTHRFGPELQSNERIFPTLAAPSTALISTAPDLLRLARALLTTSLLPREWRDRLWSAQASTGQGADNPANASYGYGFFVGTAGATSIVNHGGTGPGIDVGFDIYPELDATVIVLCNLDAPAAQDIRAWLRERIGAARVAH